MRKDDSFRRISVICFSLTGFATGERLCRGLKNRGHEVCLYTKSRYLPDSVSESTSVWAGERFRDSDAVIFIGACGIAVRSIAPHIEGKKRDPAVLVVDECGQFAISLLSGHLGGANALAGMVGEILKATVVVTTATDLHRRFAVDVFARENGCEIFHMKAAKEVSAALLAGESAGFYSEFPWQGALPEGLVSWQEPADSNREAPKVGVAVTVHSDCLPFSSTVQVVPKVLTLGLGCRKNQDPQLVEEAARRCLAQGHFYPEALEGLASIDLKKEEPGILMLTRKWDLPFVTFSGDELAEAKGDFTPSAFVREITGVDNVCERSAVLGAGEGSVLLKRKTAGSGVTTALAVRDWRICFE
ncbi:MAG: cobalamin biosynthesis protein [Clostridiales bacterium]|nr:cobalamin biosynthesis protein [Clostridiales bacterium]